jgi:large conductance mechanosensitive channel
MRGNVVDLAVAVIIGAAFGKIVDSLVSDVIMPIIGAVTGGLDFSNYYLALSSKVQSGLTYVEARKAGAVLGWGQFLTYVVNFLIVAFVLFLVIQAMNRVKERMSAPEAAPAPKEPPPEIALLSEIRDLLKARPAR